MSEFLSIMSMNDDRANYRYWLRLTKETSRSYYAVSNLYGDEYRIEKRSGKVFCNGEQIADTSKIELR